MTTDTLTAFQGTKQGNFRPSGRLSARSMLGALAGVPLPMTQPVIKAIPTKYRGIVFRSRLEAKWAAMFDRLEWRWEYEPLDLNGYIPDFILQFHKPVLAEVKPVMSFKECEQYTLKISESGWVGDALIFGAALKLGPDSFMGPECCYYGQWDQCGRDWQPGEMHHCGQCGHYSLHHTVQSYRCLVGGCYNGANYLNPVDFDEVHSLWSSATNEVQYDHQGVAI